MKAAKAEVERAIHDLKLSEIEFSALPQTSAEAIYSAAEAHFVASSGRQWWWEDFRMPATSFAFPNQDGFRYLNALVPSASESLWFIVETDSLDCFAVYESTIGFMQSVIGECSEFEYYIMPKDFRWLLCENHHAVVLAIGAEVEARLLETKIQQTLGADSP